MSYETDILDNLLSVKGKGQELIDKWGSLHEIYQNLDAVKLTPRQREVLKAAKTIHFIREDKPTISSPADAVEQVMYLQLEPKEKLVVLCMNTRNMIVEKVELYTGSVNSSQVRVAEVFREAIIRNCKSIILAHNHPTGDPTPSPNDVALTRELVQAGKLLDIDVLDHVIVGASGKWTSLKERGLGFS